MSTDYNKYIKPKHRIANFLACLFILTFSVACILLNDAKNLILGTIIPIVIVTILVTAMGFTIDYLTYRYYKYSWVRSLERQRKEKEAEEQESYNLYPIDPRLLEKGLSKRQNDALERYRVINFLLWCIANISVILFMIDFHKLIWNDIILPSVMISGTMGAIFLIFDFIAEGIIKKALKEEVNVSETDNEIKVYKNKRIYYIPICIIIGIIILVGLYDRNSSLKSIIIKSSIVIAIFLVVVIVIDIIASKIVKTINVINKEMSNNINLFEEKNKGEDRQ